MLILFNAGKLLLQDGAMLVRRGGAGLVLL